MKPKIPCKECLVYPVCRHKKEIMCTKLIEYIERHGTYEGIRKYFENVITVLEDDNFEGSLILRSVRLPGNTKQISEGCSFKIYDSKTNKLKPTIFLDNKTGRVS